MSRRWLDAGTLLTSGPFPDGSGALIVFRAEDRAAIDQLLVQDPFAREQLIEHVSVLEWQPVMGAFAS